MDDHSAPALLETQSGRLVVFYSGHAVGNLLYRMSGPHRDLNRWGPEHILKGSGLSTGSRLQGRGATYANAIYVRSEHQYYLFLRWGKRLEPYLTTSTNLRDWTAGIRLFVNEGYGIRSSDGLTHRPYLKAAADGKGVIHLAVSQSNARGPEGASLYHFKIHDEAIYRSDDTLIHHLNYLASGHPLLIASGTLVRDDSSGTVRLWDLAITSDGPAMVYEIAGRRYGVALLNPTSEWVHTELANSPDSKYRGVTVADGVPLTIYLVAADGLLQRWTSNGVDGFPDHWLVRTMTSTVRNRAPTAAPPGSGFAVAVLEGPYDSYTAFRSQIIGLLSQPDGGTAVVVGTSPPGSATDRPAFGPDE